jgi:hypothetical protein
VLKNVVAGLEDPRILTTDRRLAVMKDLLPILSESFWTNSPGDGRLTNLVDHWLAASADLGWPRPRGAAMPRLSVDSPGQYVIPLRALDGTAVAPLAERVKRNP